MKKVRRLYSQFQPKHYEIFLDPDRETAFFTGRVLITGRKIGRPSSRITFHQKGLKITAAKLTKNDRKSTYQVPITRINTQNKLDEVRLHTSDQLFAGEYTIELQFSGKITKPMHGIYPCDFELRGHKKQLIATQFESHHAREAFPCIDEPEAKATFRLSLAVPSAETAISNTPALSMAAGGNNKTIVTFEATPKMSSYLLAFVYGELGYKETITKNGVSVRVYATPDKVKLTDFALQTAARCLEFFEEYFGTPYPLPKLDLIGLPDFSAGAMENWGLITFRESVLYVDPKSSSIETKQYVAMVICHELAHQWFGNLVTMRWWDDLWLNESFANLMEYRAVDELYPDWEVWKSFVQRELGSALIRDSLPNVQPLKTNINHPDEISSLFDPSIVYAKGGSLLHMVMHLIGEDNFRRGLKSYFKKHKYSNTEAADLWSVLTGASGKDISRMMDKWLNEPGFPVLSANYDSVNKSLDVTQERLVTSPGDAHSDTVWQVPLAASSPTDPEIINKRSLTASVKTDNGYPLVLNHDGRSYYVTQYLNEQHFALILRKIEQGVISPIDRMLVVQNNLLLEKAGRVTTLQNLRLLPHYKNEREETVWGILAGIVGSAHVLIDRDEPLEKKMDAFVRPLVSPLVKDLGWQPLPDESDNSQKLRALALSMAAAAEDPAVIDNGLKLFNSFKNPTSLPPDIRQVVYYIAVRHGEDKAFNRLIKIYKEHANADEKEEIAAELTSTRKAARIKQLVEFITSADVRRQDTPTWFAWLMRNRYSRDTAWDWLKSHWDWVEENYGTDKSYDRFTRYSAMVFSYPKQLNDFKAFFEPKLNPALERAVKLGIEEIEGRIRWRQKNESAVKQWLHDLD